MKLKILLFFTFSIFILLSSFVYSDLDIPGYNFTINSNQYMRLFSMSSSNKIDSVVNVHLKSVSELSNFDKNFNNISKKEIEKLDQRAFNYIISKLDDSIIRNKLPKRRFFSAKLSYFDYHFLDSLEIVESIEKSMKLSISMDETIYLTNSTEVWNLSYTGENVGVCVIDTGIDYTHPDLGGCDSLYDNISIAYESNISFNSTYETELKNGEISIGIINETGVDSISLFFSNITLTGGDYLAIYNKEGDEIKGISSNKTNFETSNLSSDFLNITIYSSDFENKTQFMNLTNYTAHNFEEACKKVIGGWDFVNNNYDAFDDHGHGTHVAGTIAANGIISGIAPNSHVIPVKVLNSLGEGDFDNLASSIEYCIDNKERYNISVISMSLGIGSDYCDDIDQGHSFLKDLFNEALQKNMSVVVASGNEGSNENISFPACLSNTISVGSVDKSNNISDFSNRNWRLDVFSYGEDIYSTVPGSYLENSGTSMATPHVSGAIALYSDKMNRINSEIDQDTIINNFNRTNNFIEENDNFFPILDVFSFFHSSEYNVTWNLNDSYYGPNNLDYIFGSTYPSNELLIQIKDNYSNYWSGTNWSVYESKQLVNHSDNNWNYSIQYINFNHSNNYTINLYDKISEKLLINHSFTWFNSKPDFSLISPKNNSFFGPLNDKVLFNWTYNHSFNLTKALFSLRKSDQTYFNGTDWIEKTYEFNLSLNNLNKTFYFNLSNVKFNKSGNYSLKIKVFDHLKNYNTKNYNFFYDFHSPKFLNFSNYDEIKYLDDWNGIQVNSTDNTGISNFIINDTENFKINDSGFLNITDKLNVGDYEVNITVFDYSQNYNWTIFNLNVTKSEPIVHTLLNNKRKNLTIEYDNSSVLLNSSLMLGEFGKLNLTIDGIELNSSNSSNISYNYSFSELGFFKIKTYYSDSKNFYDYYETFNLGVIDSIPPIFLDIPDDNNIKYGENWSGVNFNATDNYKLDKFHVNNTKFKINSKGYLSLNQTLPVGNYYLNISINDTSGNYNWTIYNLNILKSNSSVRNFINNSRDNLTLNYGENYLIESKLVKGEFGNLSLTLNGSELAYSNNSNISFNHVFKELGIFNLSTLYIPNKNFNQSSDNLIITIEDNKIPRLKEVNFNLPIIYNDSNKYIFKTYLYDPNGVNQTKIFIGRDSENFTSFNLEDNSGYWFIDIQNYVNSSGNYTYYFWAEDNEGNSGNISSLSTFSVKNSFSENEKEINESNYTTKKGFNTFYTSDISKINKIKSNSNEIVKLNLYNNIFDNKLKVNKNISFYHYENHSLKVFNGTNLYFNKNSDKTFKLPHSLNIDDDFFGSDKEISTSFSVGSNYSISLDKPSKIRLIGEAGKNLIWMDENESYFEVENYCDDLNNPSNVDDICLIDYDGDLIIFTNHFSSFITYEKIEKDTETSGGSGGGSSSGILVQSNSETQNYSSKSDYDQFDNYKKFFFNISKGLNDFEFNKNSIIHFIKLNSENNVRNVSIFYGEFKKEYIDKNENLSFFDEENYKYFLLNSSFNFSLSNYSFNEIGFQINSSWIEKFEYDDFNYSLFYYSDYYNKWIPLETKLINITNSKYYFISNITSLGYFTFSVSEKNISLNFNKSVSNDISLMNKYNRLEDVKNKSINDSIDEFSDDYQRKVEIKGEYLIFILLLFILYFLYKIYSFNH